LFWFGNTNSYKKNNAEDSRDDCEEIGAHMFPTSYQVERDSSKPCVLRHQYDGLEIVF
jgi:hypothetical protein